MKNFVWARVDLAGGGARMALSRPGGSLSGLPADPLPSTPAVVRREEDIRYTPYPIDMGEGRHTFEAEFYYWNDHRLLTGDNGWTMSDDFVVTDMVPGSAASITARVAATGRPLFSFNTNDLEFSVNSTLLGQERLYIRTDHYTNQELGDPASFLHTYPIAAGLLNEGTNEFGFFGNSFTGTSNTPARQARFLFDWYEVTYDRELQAIGGTFALTTANGTGGNNLVQVQGFGGQSILLFDVTDPAVPQQVDVDPTQVVSDAGQEVTVCDTHREHPENAQYHRPADPRERPPHRTLVEVRLIRHGGELGQIYREARAPAPHMSRTPAAPTP